LGGRRVTLGEPKHNGPNLSFRFPADGTTPFSLLRATNVPPEAWEIVQEGSAAASVGFATVSVSNVSGGLAFYRVAPFASGGPNPILFNPTRESGEFRFEFCAPTNGTYSVERSPAIDYPLTWQPIRNYSVSRKAMVKVVDTSATAPANYYRVSLAD
ncbi:MAG TPA: hypothetical protein VK846_11640, partial [Candidatus Limnocylindria bacterium]|nr:hypothetical protein [Candidatus Limnocylindria bacterium]